MPREENIITAVGEKVRVRLETYRPMTKDEREEIDLLLDELIGKVKVILHAR